MNTNLEGWIYNLFGIVVSVWFLNSMGIINVTQQILYFLSIAFLIRGYHLVVMKNEDEKGNKK